jgi:hypothetical protein
MTYTAFTLTVLDPLLHTVIRCKIFLTFSHTHTIVDKGKESLLHKQLRIEHDELGTGGYQVIALVELEELNKDLALILLCNTRCKSTA